MIVRPSASLQSRLAQVFALAQAKTQDIRRSADRAIVRMGRVKLKRDFLRAMAEREDSYLRMHQARQDAEEWRWIAADEEEAARGSHYVEAKKRIETLLDLLFEATGPSGDDRFY